MTSATELHPLSFFNSSPMAFALMDGGAAVAPPFSPAVSTGYLEDALVEFSSKRRRFDHQLLQLEFPHAHSSYCTWEGDAVQNFDWTNQIHDFNHHNNYYYYDHSVSTDELISVSPKSRISEETNTDLSVGEMKTPELEALSPPNNYFYEHFHYPNSSSEFLAEEEFKMPISTGGSETKKTKKRKVVYPFALVKPGGIEGDMTINDINQKILMPPTRPVRHPVGAFACRPCVSADGLGLSGKAVVALTKIHTQGRRGTITIIRTKG